MTATTLGNKNRVLYKGTIQGLNQQPRKPYQESINIRDLKHGRLYQGTITSGWARQKKFEDIPDRSNPYRYYKLPEDYYGKQRNTTRLRPVSPVKPRKKIEKEPAKNKTVQKENSFVRAKPQEKQVVKLSEKRQQTPPQKPTSPATKRTAKVSPFPSPSPEPAPRQATRMNPEPIRSQPYNTRNKPEPIFPSILPVTMEEFVNREPTWRYPPERPRGNVLIPALPSSKPEGLQYRRSPDNFFDDKDTYKDSLSRSFTNVPGYSAIGSILRTMDKY